MFVAVPTRLRGTRRFPGSSWRWVVAGGVGAVVGGWPVAPVPRDYLTLLFMTKDNT